MAFNTSGSFPASLVLAQQQMTLATNYLSFDGAAGGNFAQQYLPELYEQEVERYGNRTLSGFLRMVGAEMPMTSDQVVWSEQNRLHVAYNNAAVVGAGGVADITVTITAGAGNPATSGIRVGNTILLSDNATGLVTAKALVTATNATGYVLTCELYETTAAALPGAITAGACSLCVYGSEFPKGSNGMQGAIEPGVTTDTKYHIILIDNYELSGSVAAQIGWNEVATDKGNLDDCMYLKGGGEEKASRDE